MALFLIGCEESQAVTIALRRLGHEAYSCDLKPCSGGHPEWHYQRDIFEVIKMKKWDVLIGHPPCTYLSYAGMAHWNSPGRLEKRLKALDFFGRMWECEIPRICLENPKGCASPAIAKYSQEIQPYYFGDSDLKTTWLWLKNLPPLQYTLQDNLFESATGVPRPEPITVDCSGKKRYFTDSVNRTSVSRSKTFPGIAKAMAEQWGGNII